MNASQPEAGNLAAPLVQKDTATTAGKFEADPLNEHIIRYIPSTEELARLNSYLDAEIAQAWADDAPNRAKKLRLLRAYQAEAKTEKEVQVIPLVKRAVKQNVAWVTNTIMSRHPIVTVTPSSNQKLKVLVDHPQFGPFPLERSSEEVAQAFEWWFEYVLRSAQRVPFRQVVKDAAKEAKRGQSPTWIKVCREDLARTTRAPQFGAAGPGGMGVQILGKEDQEIKEQRTKVINVSTYAMLMPADEQDYRTSRWLLEFDPRSPDRLQRDYASGKYFLVDDDEFENVLKNGATTARRPDEDQKANTEKRVSSSPPGLHNVAEVIVRWPVPMTVSEVSIDQATGETTTKKRKAVQEYDFVVDYHVDEHRSLSMIRIPYDHGRRWKVPIFDDKEPFRHADDSLAEDATPYQNVYSQTYGLEIRSAVVATTPVTFFDPGSMAGEWILENPVEPGSAIPRQRPDEIDVKNIGERNQTLLPLLDHLRGEFEKQFQIGDLQLGLDIPGRTPASSIAQVLNQGTTQSSDFLESFRESLAEVLEIYVLTEQQYMREGEVIPFDPETAATIRAALGADETMPEGVAVRFPLAPMHEQFSFTITASSDDRNSQQDFARAVSFKNIISQDSQQVANMLAAVASGKLPKEVLDVFVDDFKRNQKATAAVAKTVRKDGDDFTLDYRKLSVIAEKQAMEAQMAEQQAAAQPPPQSAAPPSPKVSISLSGKLTPEQESAAAQMEGIGGTQGFGGGPLGGGTAGTAHDNAGGMGPALQNAGVPASPAGNQGGTPAPAQSGSGGG